MMLAGARLLLLFGCAGLACLVAPGWVALFWALSRSFRRVFTEVRRHDAMSRSADILTDGYPDRGIC